MASSGLEKDDKAEEKAKGFKQFDVITDCSDHFFSKLDSSSKDGVSCDQLKIMQEWKILEKNLPESIYVRVYEERIDLLRAVIVGAAGTPYHDNLFFFDLAFPFDYPNRPPKVHYRSHGFRLNPNLYADGDVCLSLLNTWTGRRPQKWNPSESTILQVLVSIQALVLNERPYFNEPGVNPGGPKLEQESMSYTEDVFLLSCETMLCSLEHPPRHFETFVAEHFRHRADVILTACRDYTKGHARVGYFHVDEGPSSRSSIEASSKFKKSMEVLYKDLIVAFAKNGAAVWDYLEPSRKSVRKKKNRFRNICMGKISWMLALRKVKKKTIPVNRSGHSTKMNLGKRLPRSA